MMLRQELAYPRSSIVLDHLEEVVEVLQQQAPSASSRHLVASVPEDLEESPHNSFYSKGCQHLEEHTRRQVGDLEALQVDEDRSCSPCTVWGRHEDLETPNVSNCRGKYGPPRWCCAATARPPS